MAFWILSAQAGNGPGGPAISDLLLFVVLIFVGYYFLIAMPQKRERAERQKMLSNLAKGDRVVTTAGIHGKVVDISKKGEIEVVSLECARNVTIDFSRSAIAAVLKKKGEPAEAESEDKKTAESGKPGKGKGKNGA